jgi:hypothetical protein
MLYNNGYLLIEAKNVVQKDEAYILTIFEIINQNEFSCSVENLVIKRVPELLGLC